MALVGYESQPAEGVKAQTSMALVRKKEGKESAGWKSQTRKAPQLNISESAFCSPDEARLSQTCKSNP